MEDIDGLVRSSAFNLVVVARPMIGGTASRPIISVPSGAAGVFCDAGSSSAATEGTSLPCCCCDVEEAL